MSASPIVEFVDISLYRGELPLVKKLSLQVFPGDFVLFVGANGSGKTTLLNVIAGLFEPDEGQVLMRNEAMGDLGPKELAKWRTNLGLMPAQANMLSYYSVLENIMLPAISAGYSSSEARERAMESARLCGLRRLLDNSVTEISAGTKKRAALARAMVNQPQLILADSPIESLDPQTQQGVIGLFEDLAELGIAIVMTANSAVDVTRVSCKTVALGGKS